MEVQFQSPPLLVFSLFLLVSTHNTFFHGVHGGRPIENVPHPGHDNHDHHLIDMIFFHQKDLKLGNSIPLFFPIRNPYKTPKFLPKSVLDSLPFSLAALPSVLQTLRIDPDSPQAESMAETLIHCRKPPINGESKFCATSLESMLEYIGAQLGSGSSPALLTTASLAGYHGLQRFTIVEDPKEIEAPNAVACHPMPYPYAVLYCHGQRGSNRLYELETETDRDGQRVRVRILGMCHMDTSQWDPNHLGFKMLGTRPGLEPICHVFPTDSLVWVPKQSSSIPVIKAVV